jgi:PAS domain S-box-containing protein
VNAAGLSPDFRALFEASPTPFLVVAPPEWKIVAANDARLRITGKSREAQIGRKLFDVFPDDPNDPTADGVRNLTASLERVVATKATDTMVVQRYSVQEADGSFVERWWSPVNSPVLDKFGNVALIIHRVEDVSETVRLRGEAEAREQLARDQQAGIDRLRASEAKLRESEEFNRRILASSADCIKVLDLNGRIEFMSEGGMCVMEVDDFHAIQGACWPDFWPGEEHAKALAAVEEAKRGGTGRFQGFATTMKGTPRWWDVAVTPINGPDGTPEKLLSVSRDVTSAREAQTALRASEARFEAIANSIDQMIWSTRPDGFHDYYNQRWYDYTGVPEGSTDGKAWSGMFHPEDEERAWGLWRHSLATGDPYHIEYRLRHWSGEYRWVIGRAQCVRDEQGRIVRWFGTCTDIHEIVEAREVLARSGEELGQLVRERTAERNRVWEMSRDLFAIMGFDGHLKAINPAWETTFGQDEATLMSLSFREQVHPDDHDAVQAMMERLLRGENVERFEDRIRHADGGWRWISWTLVPEGDVFYAVGRDVTVERERQAELEAAQEALRQSQKMEAMGSLTGGVAHDFNNLLTPIIGSLDMLVRKGVGSERERRLIDGALQSAERAKTLVQRLLAFARRQPLQPMAVDVGGLVEGMVGLIGSTLGPTIDVRVDLADDLPPASADPNQLEMALLNLAVNARDAMPDGGELTISVKCESVWTRDAPNLNPGHYVRLRVADTGTGMDQATRERAIEPFYSTKGIGKGTGLGLSMVHGLTAQLGGGLTIESSLGQGTAVMLWLPISAIAISDEATTVAATPQRADRGIALLVDDEELVRMSTADMLVDLGFEVVEAGSAEEALRLIRHGAAPDLLVTDHLMPGMTGADLAREARALRPAMPVLVVSGYAEVDGIAPDLPRLTKPFRNAELATSVAALLPLNDVRL